MLERATACLDTGARLSLRCARRASRSRRQLHQTFWTHGAGDLDLPPSLLGSAPPPPDRAPQPDDRRRSERTSESSNAPVATESPFLDFLYPPQALALLHRVSEPRREKWEERNARRLPRGFVQATRGYASGTAGRRSPVNSDKPEPEETRIDDLPQEFVADGKDGQAVQDIEDQSQHTDTPGAAGDEEPAQDILTEAPGLLDVDFPVDQAASPRQLRNLMATSRRNVALQDAVKSMDFTTRAWELYEKLGVDEKEDPDLKTALLQFLATHYNEDAETHCLELYSSIPAAQRSMDIYKAALSVFLRCNLYGLAEQGHAEALDRLPNAHELSGWLCRYAIEQEMWDMAFRVKQQLDARHEGILQAVAAKSFWQQITDTPDLLSKAISLSKHFRILERANAMAVEFREFCKVIFREGIVQEFVSYHHKGNREVSEARKTYQRQRIRYLLGRVVIRNPEAAKFFRDVIMAIIAPETSIHYPDVHTVVSYMYMKYRKMSGIVPEENMLRRFLHKLTRHADGLQRLARNPHSIDIDFVHADWNRFHNRMPPRELKELMTFYARQGRVDRVDDYLQYLQQQHPEYEDQKEALWTLIYVHARRADVANAKRAFEKVKEMAKAAGVLPERRCWNVLLHAHSRADDLDGALETLRTMISTSDLKPDQYAFHPIAEIYAGKGDPESVNDMLDEYDEVCKEKRHTALYGSLMQAFVNNNELDAAQGVLEEIVEKRTSGEILGSLTGCFNILLTTYAMRREVDDAMRVYRWMKSEKVWMNENTYAALMRALIAYRQTPAAHKILRTVMRDQGLEANAFHYALVMTGYISQGMYLEAVELGRKMERKNIRKSASFNVAYLQAKALLESKHKQSSEAELPLEDTLRDMELMLKSDAHTGLANKQPQMFDISQPAAVESAFFEQLIYVHGKRRCLDAVKELIARYKERTDRQGVFDMSNPPTSRLLAAVMVASTSAKEWKDVDEAWNIAKKQADEITLLKPAPAMKAMLESQSAPEMLEMPLLYPAQEQSPKKDIPDKQPNTTTASTDTTKDPFSQKPKISHIFRHILTPTLCQLITALSLQSRFMDMISTVATVLSEGYLLDNRTWNHFIESLLDSRPPLALLAFRLTERYLITNFPGWRHNPNLLPNKSHRAQGLQHIKASYLRPGQLMPQYRTLVKLASAMLELGRAEAVGRGRRGELERYVGTTRLIRRLAPRTLHVVQTMPAINDSLQRSLMPKDR